jgi:hypothetical protein
MVNTTALRLLSARDFSKSTLSLNSAQGIKVEAEKEEESIIQSMGGWYPLVGLGLTAMIGKEFIILNASSLNFVFFYGFWGWLYMTQGEALSKMFNDDMEAIRKNFLYDPLDFTIEGYKQAIISFKAQTSILDYIKDVAKHSPLSIKAEAEALNKKAALEAREKVIQQLSAQKSLQQLKNLRVDMILQENFADDVEIAWKESGKAHKSKFMDNAIADLESGFINLREVKDDPVKIVYKAELERYAQKLQPYRKQDIVSKAKAWPVSINLL